MNGESGLMLNGHRALITGAGRGLGEACAKTLAQAGSEVVLVARSRDQLETVRQTINDSGGNASVHVADLTKMDEIRRLEGLGAFTILVNNAGINRPEPFEQVNEKDFDDVMDLNVKSAFFVAQSVVKGMIQAGRGGSDDDGDTCDDCSNGQYDLNDDGDDDDADGICNETDVCDGGDDYSDDDEIGRAHV